MAAEAPPKPLTIDEVAERLRVSHWSVRRRIAAAELPAVKIGTGPKAPVRVDADELERFVYGEAS